ncbi:MAG: type II toxin-antitoxin system RelE/ParE family toxin [Oscillospiraceae bacterium]
MSGQCRPAQADTILGKLEQAIRSLHSLPLRGNVPPELEIVGITRYREIHVHPWRIIYEALEAVVLVHWVFDSRRDVAGQFAQKMLRG